MQPRRLHYLLISIICGLSFSFSAHAIPQLQTRIFTNTGTLGANLSTTIFDPFDSSLGTLDSVNILVSGFLRVSGSLPPNLVSPNNTPSPYAYNITVTQSMYGLIGFNNFGFATPAQFLYNGVASGIPGDAFFFDTPITYSLNFNETSDLLGFTIPSGNVATFPPAYVSGLREDFLDNLLNSSNGLVMQNQLITTSSALLPVVPDVLMSNTVFLTYNYTPFETSVPEPSALLLLGSGLFILACMRRRYVKPRNN